jgi:hypothetical protein
MVGAPSSLYRLDVNMIILTRIVFVGGVLNLLNTKVLPLRLKRVKLRVNNFYFAFRKSKETI